EVPPVDERDDGVRRVRVAEPFDELVRTRTVALACPGGGLGGEHPVEMRVLGAVCGSVSTGAVPDGRSRSGALRVTFRHADPLHSRLLPHGRLHLALSLFTAT